MISAAVRQILDRSHQQHRRVLRKAQPVVVQQAANERQWHVEALPHQVELFNDLTTKILGMTAGFGSGKSWSAARKAVQLALLNPGCDGIVTEPTIPLLVKVMFPALEEALQEAGLKFRFVKQDKIFYVRIKGRTTRIICDSMENYARLIGVNAAWIVADEFDTSKQDIAIAAYQKLLGRLRAGTVRQFVIVSTPEGFRAMYQIFITEAAKDSKRLIKAKTTDNHHLPADYIETLRAQYPANLIDAYLNGEFVNLTSGTIYYAYDPEKNRSRATVRPGDTLYVGMDFNVQHMAAVVRVLRPDANGELLPHAVDEFVDLFDTQDMIEQLEARYGGRHVINVYPDSSGKNRKSTDASTSDIAMLEAAGFRVHYHQTNPFVRSRINAMNAMFCNGQGERRYFVNDQTCPNYARALQYQVYDEKGEPDKTSGFDHLCFTGRTVVETEKGFVSFDRLPAKGKVRGANGEFIDYEKAGITGFNKVVVRVVFANGYVIECTPDHKFLTETGKWVEAKNLSGQKCLLSLKQDRTLTEKNSISVGSISATPEERATGDYTAPYGFIISAKYLKDATFITLMKTGQTIRSTISRVCQVLSTYLSMQGKKKTVNASQTSVEKTNTEQKNGTPAKKGENGTGSIMKSTDRNCTLKSKEPVQIAEKLSTALSVTEIEKTYSAGKHAQRAIEENQASMMCRENASNVAANLWRTNTQKSVAVLSIDVLGTEGRVYCLKTTEGMFKLSENSPIVSNCDAGGYDIAYNFPIIREVQSLPSIGFNYG